MRTLITKEQKMIRTIESNQIIDFTHSLKELPFHLFVDFIKHFVFGRVFGHLEIVVTANLAFSVRKITPNVAKLLWAVISLRPCDTRPYMVTTVNEVGSSGFEPTNVFLIHP